MTQSRSGEAVLMIRFGLIIDYPVARDVLQPLLLNLTTPEAARAQFLKAPLSYVEAATMLGVGRKFLARRVHDDPTFPHGNPTGGKVVFYPWQIDEIQQRLSRGELRYDRSGGHSWRGPAA